MKIFRKLDLYILYEVVKPFFGVSVLILFIFLMFQTLRLADFVIVHKVPIVMVLRMAGFLLIGFFPLVISVSFLTAVLVGFGRLSADSEVVAIKSVGCGLDRMAMPVTALAAAIVAFSLMLNLEWAPWAERSFAATMYQAGHTKVTASLQEGTFNHGFFDLILYTEKIDEESGRLYNVFIRDERQPSYPMEIIAEQGEIRPVVNRKKLGGQMVLQLYRGSMHRRDPVSAVYERTDFNEYSLFLKVEAFDGADLNRPRMLSLKKLTEEMRKYPAKHQRHLDTQSELWKRLSISFSPLIFGFLGIGFGVVRSRSVQGRGFLVTFVTMLIYWEALMLGVWSSTNGYLPPWIGMQIPNLVIAGAAIFAFKRAGW